MVPNLTVLALWILASLLCQLPLRFGAKPDHVYMVWQTIDFVALSAIIRLREGVASPQILAFGLLIAGAGLSAKPKLVWFGTLVGVLCELTLVMDAAWRGRVLPQPYNPPLTVVVLIAIGFVTAVQAKRMRMLSRYYDRRESA
jgi:hypothetical protein